MNQTTDIVVYVQLISGTILGVALGNLLSGATKFIQQPQTYKFNILHGLWMFFIMGSTFVFWWQEALTFSNVTWTFPLYLFQIAYCSTYLFMTAVLLPDNVDHYGTHYDYFIARRQWFYGALILSYVLGIGNSIVKEGWDEILVDPSYIVVNVILIGLLVAGMVFDKRKLHIAIAAILCGADHRLHARRINKRPGSLRAFCIHYAGGLFGRRFGVLGHFLAGRLIDDLHGQAGPCRARRSPKA